MVMVVGNGVVVEEVDLLWVYVDIVFYYVLVQYFWVDLVLLFNCMLLVVIECSVMGDLIVVNYYFVWFWEFDLC